MKSAYFSESENSSLMVGDSNIPAYSGPKIIGRAVSFPIRADVLWDRTPLSNSFILSSDEANPPLLLLSHQINLILSLLNSVQSSKFPQSDLDIIVDILSYDQLDTALRETIPPIHSKSTFYFVMPRYFDDILRAKVGQSPNLLPFVPRERSPCQLTIPVLKVNKITNHVDLRFPSESAWYVLLR